MAGLDWSWVGEVFFLLFITGAFWGLARAYSKRLSLVLWLRAGKFVATLAGPSSLHRSRVGWILVRDVRR